MSSVFEWRDTIAVGPPPIPPKPPRLRMPTDGRPTEGNPWGLTAAEGNALDLVITHYGSKRAAHAVGMSERTMETTLKRARLRMRVPTYDRIEYILLWDRWRQGEGKGVPA
jgi:hypothetical protein